MNDDLLLQPATPDDLPQLLALSEAYCAHDGVPFDREGVEAALVALLDNPGLGLAWLIIAQGELAGYLVVTFGFSLEYGGRYASIDEFFLGELYRGRGIGSTVIAALKAFANREQLAAIELEATRDNDAARTFYARHQFADTGRRLLVYRADDA